MPLIKAEIIKTEDDKFMPLTVLPSLQDLFGDFMSASNESAESDWFSSSFSSTENTDTDTLWLSNSSLCSTTSSFKQTSRRSPSSKSVLSMAEMADLELRQPWLLEDLNALNTVPPGFYLPSLDKIDSLSLGCFKELAIMYLNLKARSPEYVGLGMVVPKTTLHLSSHADALGMTPLVFRLHLEFTSKISRPQSHQEFIEYRKSIKFQRKWRNDDKIMALPNLYNTDYYDGIDLILGRERDRIIRPMLNKLFTQERQKCREALLECGLRMPDMRNWNSKQLCKALYYLGKSVDINCWTTATQLHIQKVNKKNGLRKL
jgi:hypothetical protein